MQQQAGAEDVENHFVRGTETRQMLLALLADEEGWRFEKSRGGASVSSRPDETGFWLRIEVDFEEENDYDQLLDVLHTSLETRQKEWHELLIPGGRVQELDDSRRICYFAYRSPWPMSDRDCLYAAQANLEHVQTDGAAEFKVFYWTIVDDAVEPPRNGRVRIDFQAAHWVRRAVHGQGKCRYIYIQRSDAKVHLPDFLLKSIQVDILLGEAEGLRKAISTSSVPPK